MGYLVRLTRMLQPAIMRIWGHSPAHLAYLEAPGWSTCCTIAVQLPSPDGASPGWLQGVLHRFLATQRKGAWTADTAGASTFNSVGIAMWTTWRNALTWNQACPRLVWSAYCSGLPHPILGSPALDVLRGDAAPRLDALDHIITLAKCCVLDSHLFVT
jgi:transcription elongation factor